MSVPPGILARMYRDDVRERAAGLRAAGMSWSEVSRILRVNRSTLRAWATNPEGRRSGCPRCDQSDLDAASYSALLGFYLGDGCVSRAPRYYVLRVSCDKTLPGIVADVADCIQAVKPTGSVFHGAAPGVVVVSSNWKHWPCLFPQHGPGRKHERPIVLEEWQRRIVESNPGAFLRGLFHSDGCRVMNSTRRRVAGEVKTYRYPRWQFTNVSSDIRELCCWALDLVAIPWRQSNWKTISVSRRDAVARLDELIGLKS